MSTQSLIDKASKLVGSRYKLAQEMHIQPGVIYDWEAGRRVASPEDRARLAGFAREDAVQELVRATLEKTAGTHRGEQLKQVLGKSLHQTGEACLGVLLGLVSLTFGSLKLLDVLRCILC